MPETVSTRLLTSRLRTTIGIALTSLMLALTVHGPVTLGHVAPVTDGWIPLPFLHGWAAMLVKIALYAYLCWLAFWFVHGTAGRERAFVLGWAVAILIAPLKYVGPEWMLASRISESSALVIAIVAAVLLLLHPPPAKNAA